MERAWVFETLAVTVARIDFLDPALDGEVGARERGVRVEVRPVSSSTTGSVYVSPSVALQPATCRIDLLESAPGAADRMHWHPEMTDGEPGERVFEPAMSQDPCGWLADRLAQVAATATPENEAMNEAMNEAVNEAADEVVAAVRQGLEWARQPWPAVRHDSRGMAPT